VVNLCSQERTRKKTGDENADPSFSKKQRQIKLDQFVGTPATDVPWF
jgi:hypothetical protein